MVDVRAKQLELTRAAIREAILAGDLDHYRVVVEALAGEFDVMDVATAAVKLAHLAESGGAELKDIEHPTMAPGRDRGEKRGPKKERGERSDRPARRPEAPMTRIYVGTGRLGNMRAGDLVGAIANEAGIDAKDIGAIEISDRFSLVELPEDQVDRVIAALRATTIKGKRQTVRRDLARRSTGRGRS